jgi:hypothetical protein
VRLGGWPLPIKLVGSASVQRIARRLDREVSTTSSALEKRAPPLDRADASERADAAASTVGASLDL